MAETFYELLLESPKIGIKVLVQKEEVKSIDKTEEGLLKINGRAECDYVIVATGN
jgi:thioredoxin reductase